MNFFGKWFVGLQGKRKVPKVKFGRYNEGIKSEERLKAWDKAAAAFKANDYLESVQQFLLFLYDPVEDNVQWERGPRKIEFIIYHGSQAIEGWANAFEFQAIVELGTYDVSEENLYAELLEYNYHLTYSKYCWHKGMIKCKFTSNSLDASPYKLLHGLRELALETDRQDDLALANYSDFIPKFSGRVAAIEVSLLETMVNFYHQQLRELQSSFSHCGLDAKEYPGAYAYLLLSFCYKIDYLLRPEGQLMETFESIHEDYFQGNPQIDQEKNETVLKQISAFASNDLEHWREEFYQVTHTFGNTTPVSSERLKSFLEVEVEKMDWYVQEGHREVALAIPDYIVGYCLFHFALPGPFNHFFQLYYEVMESEYFAALGFYPALRNEGVPVKSNILSLLKDYVKDQHIIYPELDFPLKTIRFDSAFHFSKSYILALCQMKW